MGAVVRRIQTLDFPTLLDQGVKFRGVRLPADIPDLGYQLSQTRRMGFNGIEIGRDALGQILRLANVQHGAPAVEHVVHTGRRRQLRQTIPFDGYHMFGMRMNACVGASLQLDQFAHVRNAMFIDDHFAEALQHQRSDLCILCRTMSPLCWNPVEVGQTTEALGP